MLSLAHFLITAAIVFTIAIIGIWLNRNNIIIILMAIELMLLAINTNFIAFSYYRSDLHGQIFVFFILTVAASETAIGLTILVNLFNQLGTVDIENLNKLKG